jgi:hypothetical protein
MVYTPLKTTIAGGHFYTYETMHLTELASSYDQSKDRQGDNRQDFATNAFHPDLYRFNAHMVMALPYLVPDNSMISPTLPFLIFIDNFIAFYQRPIYAMLAMLKRSQMSYKGALDVVDKEISQEIQKAIEIGDTMLKQWTLQWADIEKYVTQLPSDWNDLGLVLNLNFLLEHQSIS